METLPGQLLYEIAKFNHVKYVSLLECFSTKIKSKLRATVSAYQYALKKVHRSKRLNFDRSKTLLKSLCRMDEEMLRFVPYYTTGGNWGGIYNLQMKAAEKYVYKTKHGAGSNVLIKSAYAADDEKFTTMPNRWPYRQNSVKHAPTMQN